MEHNLHFYCSAICPLLAGAEVPWACEEFCNYQPERKAWEIAPHIYRRRISQFVKRDPREYYHAHPVQPWMYGTITGDLQQDATFPFVPTP